MPLKFSFNWNRTIYVNCFCTTELTQLNRLRNKKKNWILYWKHVPNLLWNSDSKIHHYSGLKYVDWRFRFCTQSKLLLRSFSTVELWLHYKIHAQRTNAQGESNKIQLKSLTPKISLFWKIRMFFVVKSFGLVSNSQYVLQVR